MNATICMTRKLGAFATGLVLGLASITCVAEPVVIEMDLPSLNVVEKASTM